MTSKIKAVLIPLLTLTLLVPFGTGNASQSDTTDEMPDHIKQRLLDLFNKGNIVQYKIDKQLNKASTAETEEQRDYHLAKADKLKVDMANIVAKINRLAPLTERVTGTVSQPEQGATGQSSSPYQIVGSTQRGCDGNTQYYIALMRINAPSDTTSWDISYTDPISVGWNPVCWDSSFSTYEIIIQNHSDGWICAANNIVDSNSVFDQTCVGKTISDGDFLHITTIANYTNWRIEKSDFLVI